MRGEAGVPLAVVCITHRRVGMLSCSATHSQLMVKESGRPGLLAGRTGLGDGYSKLKINARVGNVRNDFEFQMFFLVLMLYQDPLMTMDSAF